MASASGDYPVIYNFPVGVAATETGQPLQGANDWTCHPSAAHPRPVVLVPGLSGNSGRDYQAAAPLLANNGYCVFAFDFSDRGFESNVTAAAGLSDFVDRVLAATGATDVDLVGHSQGGMMPRYYLEFLGGADKDSLSPLGSAPWADFETKLGFAGTPAYVQVQALDAAGNVIGQSAVVEPKAS